jgi:hypothetical protein
MLRVCGLAGTGWACNPVLEWIEGEREGGRRERSKFDSIARMSGRRGEIRDPLQARVGRGRQAICVQRGEEKEKGRGDAMEKNKKSASAT